MALVPQAAQTPPSLQESLVLPPGHCGKAAGPFPASLTCPLQHVLDIVRCPGHQAGLVRVLQPQNKAPSVLLGKEVVVQGSAEATQVQEAWQKRTVRQVRECAGEPQLRGKQAVCNRMSQRTSSIQETTTSVPSLQLAPRQSDRREDGVMTYLAPLSGTGRPPTVGIPVPARR